MKTGLDHSASLGLAIVVALAQLGCSDDGCDDACTTLGLDTSTGDGDPTAGDGDPTTGDGDPTTGDGDGDPGDGDGDPGDPCAEAWAVKQSNVFALASWGGGSILTKVDIGAQTDAELYTGQYETKPDGFGPARPLSSDLNGNAVVAHNDLSGHVVAMYMDPAQCDGGTNGVPGVQTSDGSTFLPYAEEDCRIWEATIGGDPNDILLYAPWVSAVAWTPGVREEGQCEWTDTQVWVVSHPDEDQDLGVVRAALLDGATGAELDAFDFLGGAARGAASDGDGNLWIYNTDGLHRIDRLAFTRETWNISSAGTRFVIIDDVGRVWLGASKYYDPEVDTVVSFPTSVGSSAVDLLEAGGLHWSGQASELRGLDRDSLQIVETFMGPESLGFDVVTMVPDGAMWRYSTSGLQIFDTQAGFVRALDPFPSLTHHSGDANGYQLRHAGVP